MAKGAISEIGLSENNISFSSDALRSELWILCKRHRVEKTSKIVENYVKYFEKVCSLLKPNSLIVIDNASYHSRNSEDYPISKWRKAQFQKSG